jgi:hypothetical protein
MLKKPPTGIRLQSLKVKFEGLTQHGQLYGVGHPFPLSRP